MTKAINIERKLHARGAKVWPLKFFFKETITNT